MIALKGLYLTPDRYFLILLVPALALGVARRYVLDFLPFIALIIVYEELRGVAHLSRPHPYYAPQLDIDRWLFGGTVPTIWLQHQLWHGSLSWWKAALSRAHQAALHRAADAALPDLAARPRARTTASPRRSSPSRFARRDRLRAVARGTALDGQRATAGSRPLMRIDNLPGGRATPAATVRRRIHPDLRSTPATTRPPCPRCTPPTRCWCVLFRSRCRGAGA